MSLSRSLLFSVLGFSAALTLAEVPGVTLSDAWVRALPPTQPVTAAYVTITNEGVAPITLSGARVEGAGRVEIHTTRQVDGLLRMEQLSTLSVEPGQTQSLAPGGAHFMLFDLESMPRAGENRQLCLLFESGNEICTAAAVRKSADADQHEHHQHH